MTDTSRIHAHRRQYVIRSDPVRAAPDWCSATLGPGLVLSHCPDLPVARLTDRNGTDWTLLGVAISTDADHDTPQSLIAATQGADMETAAEHLSGRWLLIGDGRVIPDATALLSCLYTGDGDGPLITSSPALAASVGRTGPRSLADDRIPVVGRGLTWFPPPGTRFKGVRRLLPSQTLRLRDGAVLPKRLIPRVPSGDTDATMTAMIARLTRALHRLSDLSPEIDFGLTAGRDSRAILGVAARAGLSMRTFTRVSDKVSIADRILPPALADIVGMPHRYLRDTAPRNDRRAMLDLHAAGHVAVGQVTPFLDGIRDELRGIMTNGGGFGLVLGYGPFRDLPKGPVPPDGIDAAILTRLGEPATSSARHGLRLWLEWARAHPCPALNWHDRWILEQRRCGWQAAKEQVFDMQDVVRVPVLNCGWLWAAMFSLPEDFRARGGIQTVLMERTVPDLLRHPFNPPDTAYALRHPATFAARTLWKFKRRHGLIG